MTLSQFSMVEELASLVKDNFPCKYLILSVEDMLINYLQNDASQDGVLELEPMNSYNRLLVHRLAEVFGPGILVSDFLSQDAEMQSPMTYDVLRRKEVFPGQKVEAVTGPSLDERETAYFAARQRIFSEDTCDSKLVKERPKKDPVVARRMITRALGQADKDHALGQADKGLKQELASSHMKEFKKEEVEGVKIKYTEERNTHSSNKMETKILLGKGPRACAESKVHKSSNPVLVDNSSKGTSSAEMAATKDNYLRQERMGAAKRLFANALRTHRRDVNVSKNPETKETSC